MPIVYKNRKLVQNQFLDRSDYWKCPNHETRFRGWGGAKSRDLLAKSMSRYHEIGGSVSSSASSGRSARSGIIGFSALSDLSEKYSSIPDSGGKPAPNTEGVHCLCGIIGTI